MLPVDSRQLENVKGELLKLTKRETMAQHSLDRRAEETEEQNNSRLPNMAQRGHERRAEGTEAQSNIRLSAMLELFFTPYLFRREERKKPKNNEIKDCQTWHNAGWRENPKKQKNKETADCQTWHNAGRREVPKKTEEQRNSQLVRQDVSRDLKE
ncbi:hypothetical protein AVEN_254199-1 [Araneus ventricosus]|uniref:STPR domain-containing protein n=1 Tax=Araneus ventricosus TaxID=182803 RepID=A0A4Y2QU72_ARAVE|nr:hypothetical protein AVEN_254199-1 [Araneus ventricosus]